MKPAERSNLNGKPDWKIKAQANPGWQPGEEGWKIGARVRQTTREAEVAGEPKKNANRSGNFARPAFN